MSNRDKWLIGIVIVGGVLVALISASPFLGCLYRNHRFESLVRFKIDSPDCQKTIPGRSTECCQCFLAFDGVNSKDDVQFLGGGLSYSYDEEHHIFQVGGEGQIKNNGNSFEVHSGHVYINGKQVPIRSTPMKVLVKALMP